MNVALTHEEILRHAEWKWQNPKGFEKQLIEGYNKLIAEQEDLQENFDKKVQEKVQASHEKIQQLIRENSRLLNDNSSLKRELIVEKEKNLSMQNRLLRVDLPRATGRIYVLLDKEK